jgi:hypothetical protein
MKYSTALDYQKIDLIWIHTTISMTINDEKISLPFDQFKLYHYTVVVTRSRRKGDDEDGEPFEDALPGALLSGGVENIEVVREHERALLNELNVEASTMIVGVVCGGAEVAFIDDLTESDMQLKPVGYYEVEAVDAVFGYGESVKACRLGDCGFLVIDGLDREGRAFNGFIHTTRLNLNGNDQFVCEHGQPVGGVQLMLERVVAHYEPKQLQLRLTAGIAPQFYIHDFRPTRDELAEEPSLTAEQKRDAGFRGWFESGWIQPHYIDGTWDGVMYEANMYGALRQQIERAGLLAHYDEQHIGLNGDPTSGHASHRAATLGLIEETRDLYLLIPKKVSS